MQTCTHKKNVKFILTSYSVKMTIVIAAFTVFGGLIMNSISNSILEGRPNAEEMRDPSQNQARIFGVISSIFAVGSSVGCFGCLWAGLKTKTRLYCECLLAACSLLVFCNLYLG